jgi:hypothetical protein
VEFCQQLLRRRRPAREAIFQRLEVAGLVPAGRIAPSAAPVDKGPNTVNSAARPPSSTDILFSSSSRVIRKRSSVGRWIV